MPKQVDILNDLAYISFLKGDKRGQTSAFPASISNQTANFPQTHIAG